MSNTVQRVLSALVLMGIAFYTIQSGVLPMVGLVFVISALALDEFFVNLLGQKRASKKYWLTMSFHLGFFVLVNLLLPFQGVFFSLNILSFSCCVLLLIYLFFTPIESDRFLSLLRTFPHFFSLVVMTLPALSVSSLLHYPSMEFVIGLLLFLSFGMDTGAWFFGKKYGKHKLWPAVSPGKTIEGLIGGVVTSTLLSVLFCLVFDLEGSVVKSRYYIFFPLFGLIGQAGDLIQSKIKRQSGVKDSSSLIPGHGGVYDRIDGLLLVAPLYYLFLSIISE